jgi:hypothetical protein
LTFKPREGPESLVSCRRGQMLKLTALAATCLSRLIWSWHWGMGFETSELGEGWQIHAAVGARHLRLAELSQPSGLDCGSCRGARTPGASRAVSVLLALGRIRA